MNRISKINILSLIAVFLVSGCTTDRLIKTKSYDIEFQQCWDIIKHANGNSQILNLYFDEEINRYQEVIEEILVSREKALELTESIRLHGQEDEPVPPAILEDLNIQMKKGIGFEEKISRGIAQNECWFLADKETLEEKGFPALTEDVRLKGVMLALSGTLTLYDIYMTTVSVINDNDRIRRYVNQGDIGYGKQKDQIKEVTNAAQNIANLLFVRKQITYFENNIDKYKEEYQKNKNVDYLTLLILQSPSYSKLTDMSFDEATTERELTRQNEVVDNFTELNRVAVNGVSEFFGNLVGLVEERKGKLYGDKEVELIIDAKLRAGDILLEKTPFRLTDKMIPGHWGHAAIWVGTAQEIKQLGIWDHEIVKQYHEQILSGKGVVEALRSGVTMNTLSHFLNIDDFAIIRKKEVSDEERANVIIRTLRQVGKDYDFNYDIETTDKIVCSQLVYLAYTDISWPTEKLAGRYTISPDNVGFKATNNGPLELVLFYHDGKKVTNDATGKMQKLMKVN